MVQVIGVLQGGRLTGGLITEVMRFNESPFKGTVDVAYVMPGERKERLAYGVRMERVSLSERLNVGLESIRICDHGGRDNSLVIVTPEGERMCVECGTRTRVF